MNRRITNFTILSCIAATMLVCSALILAQSVCTRCGPGLAVRPSSLTFPPQVVHTKSAAMSISLSSGGTLPVHLNSIVISGSSFSQTNNCPKSMPKGVSCHIDVTFDPKSVGTLTGKVTIHSNEGKFVVNLTGTGVAPK